MAAWSRQVKDPSSLLRTATRRAKSDVANKLVSMFLHELSRSVSQGWSVRVDGEQYEGIVRERFGNHCPYCSRDLGVVEPVIEHLDGMNRYRAGLHVPGNVLVACRKCNLEKRRDDSLRVLSLGLYGWESFLSHDGQRCDASCQTCHYWEKIWPDCSIRTKELNENLQRIRIFRNEFPEFQAVIHKLSGRTPELLAKLYSDCQAFAETEIRSLLERFIETPDSGA